MKGHYAGLAGVIGGLVKILYYYSYNSTPNAAIKFTGSWGEETGQRAGFFVSEGKKTCAPLFSLTDTISFTACWPERLTSGSTSLRF